MSDRSKYFELLSQAYKKLKAYVFFDKTQLPLRDKIVEFEQGEINFEEQLDKLAKELEGGLIGELPQGILGKIDCYIYPKKIAKATDSKCIKNYFDEVTVTEAQYFIEMDVLGHVLGIAWIMLVGYEFDKAGYENSYGNRLRKEWDDLKTYSPYLFQPYFSQYESWRDNGLEQAKKLLSNQKNVIMLSLDLSRFYYSVDIDEITLTNQVKDILDNKETEDKKICETLTNFIYKVIDKYSQSVAKYSETIVRGRKILPIGFAPSAILGNLCLKKFDDAIIRGWNPTYYGRYVDDILIIDKVGKNSPICKLVSGTENDINDAIHYFLCCNHVWHRFDNPNIKTCSCKTKKPSKRCKGLFQIHTIKGKKSRAIYEYSIAENFLTFKGSKIKLKGEKVKLFYFDSSQSDILIQCFQKNILKNVSEFRYLPEDEPIFNTNDYTEIYTLTEKDGPNKIRGIESFELDRFSLSKFLGKYTRISGLIDDNKESQFYADINKIFTPDAIVGNYSTWEKVFTVLVTNGKLEELSIFVENIYQTISKLLYNDTENISENNIKIQAQMIKSLKKVLYAAINRSLALIWGDERIKTLNNFIQKHFSVNLMCIEYCRSRMIDKYAMPLLIDDFIPNIEDDYNSNRCINLTCIEDLIFLLEKKGKHNKDDQKKYKYTPYTVTIMDLTIKNLIHKLINGDNIDENNIDEDNDKDKKGKNGIINVLIRKYCNINYGKESVSEDYIKKYLPVDIEIEGIKRYVYVESGIKYNKVKFSIANAQLNDNNLQNILQHSSNRSYQRYEDLVKIVNMSIVERVNMLVLPEGFLPFSWLPIFARTCAKNQMAAVVGIEHFCIAGKVENITATILPYQEKNHKFAYIDFHKKTHFAPREKKIIESAGEFPDEGKSYTLFGWNNFWFAPYCCYELSSIKDRSLFQSYADAIIAVEWNADVNYYSNIIESLARDLHCYCIQVNTAKYGDSRITQPSKTVEKDILRIKGGKNATILVDEIDIENLRRFQLLGNIVQSDNDMFKTTPPDFDRAIVQAKQDGKLWKKIKFIK